MNKILIYNSGGGLGDSIQLFPLLLSLKAHYKKAKFFYLGAHSNHFKGSLKEYNIDLETVDLVLAPGIPYVNMFTVRLITVQYVFTVKFTKD